MRQYLEARQLSAVVVQVVLLRCHPNDGGQVSGSHTPQMKISEPVALALKRGAQSECAAAAGCKRAVTFDRTAAATSGFELLT